MYVFSSGGVISIKLDEYSIDERPEEIFIEAMIHDPDSDIFISQANVIHHVNGITTSKAHAKGILPSEGNLPLKMEIL